MMFSLTMLPPVAVSLFYNDGGWPTFLFGALLVLLTGLVLWLPTRRVSLDLRVRDGFIIVAMFWLALGFASAVPFILSPQIDLSTTDSIFEAMSGLTTTGATILTGLDELPRSILYYRQQLQWLGGMGIIVLAVAVLPMLGVGGMQLYRAETPGPVKDTKLMPRISGMANALWQTYFVITIACGVAYFAAGMELFDAIGHALTTVAIGGFSTHDLSFGYYAATGHPNATMIELIAVFFMFVGGINFALHFLVWDKKSLRHYLADSEFRAYVTVLVFIVLVTIMLLHGYGTYETWSEAFTKGLFQAVSIGTTTGYTTADYSSWPRVLPVMLIFASFIGGCAGSTGGGMKVIRWLLVYKQGVREVIRYVHPSAEIPVKLGKTAVQTRVIESVWGFFSVYIVLFGFMMLLLMATGLDQVTAFSAVAATLNNLGPGLGEVSSNFTAVGDAGKWIAIAAMLLGRLEIFTLLVLVTPAFWQR